ncbi:Wadjet anti-phage system protein JetD domain-containing protein [Sulfurimonas sp.]|uniref:Wadjet anti-phage system protein JetD domain-containing protein n=1 Tax=Sulfurimonas sp. TaxID=2022749 RepID=UPI002B4705A3|nr:Wadjet anti-phage system protein JetD domain-containing protein [Sulfurimonas sp.]
MAKFYDKKEVFSKALKIYESGKLFLDFMHDSELFPLEIKLKRLKQSDLQYSFSIIIDELNLLQKESLELIYKEFNFKTIGLQRLPVSVVFKDKDIFLDFIKKSDEFSRFVKNYEMIITKYPSLKKLLLAKPFLVLDYNDVWNKLFSVCNFFIINPRPNIYIRELSIKNIDTKFIEKYKKILDKLLTILLNQDNVNTDITTLSNYGFEKKYYLKYPLPTIRFRILDSSQTIGGLSDISLNIDEFKHLYPTCKYIYIVENKITTLSFPPLKNSMVIFGNGYGVEVLRDVKWLHEKEIFYWGDIDSDGFAILSQVRGYFKGTVSILMDKQTKDNFEYFGVEVKATTCKKLINLTVEEKNMFDNIGNFRLEQERIGFEYIINSLANRL